MIPEPDLDDRTFADLVAAARDRIRQVDPGWDPTVHDPGMVLVEAFAHLTDMLLYRLNRVPGKLYVVYLNLLGTTLRPPDAATATLVFTRTAATGDVVIPRGTEVGVAPGPPGTPQPVFRTTGEAVLYTGTDSVRVSAVDAEFHRAVPLGTGTGRPGQVVVLPRAPALAGGGLAVGVEVPAGTVLRSGQGLQVGGRTYRTCRIVEAFADASSEDPVVRVDLHSGTVMFPWWDAEDPAPPAAPALGAAIVGWYRTGGGAAGNVPAETLTVLRSPIPGVACTNDQAATGGRDGESVEHAMRRAPQEFQARDRAVTARDYEALALRQAGVGRARSLTRRELWSFAAPGEVETVLVPYLPPDPAHRITPEVLASHSREEVRAAVRDHLAERATIGADPVVRFAQCKQVVVRARVHVRADEDPDGVERRILQRLHAEINPLPADPAGYGSGFGRPLRTSNLYRVMEESEPGVVYVDRVRLEVVRAPDQDVTDVAAAHGRPGTWFAAGGDSLFRTLNSGRGWELCAGFPGEEIRVVVPYPMPAPGRSAPVFAGKVAVATVVGQGSAVHVSDDLGETWRTVATVGFRVLDLAWLSRGGEPVLLMAGTRGLYELADRPDAAPVQNVVDGTHPSQGFAAVEAFVDVRGQTGVAVAAEGGAGIWLSPRGGAAETFHQIAPPGQDVRCLAIQPEGSATFLWIGRAVPEGGGSGCARLKLVDLERTGFTAPPAASWEQLTAGWSGGSCAQISVQGGTAYAATYSGGVLVLTTGGERTWVVPDVNAGLPLRDRARFDPVPSLAAGLNAEGVPLVVAGGARGVFLSEDTGTGWRSCSAKTGNAEVTVPDTWVFCSGEHEIEVVRDGG